MCTSYTWESGMSVGRTIDSSQGLKIKNALLMCLFSPPTAKPSTRTPTSNLWMKLYANKVVCSRVTMKTQCHNNYVWHAHVFDLVACGWIGNNVHELKLKSTVVLDPNYAQDRTFYGVLLALMGSHFTCTSLSLEHFCAPHNNYSNNF